VAAPRIVVDTNVFVGALLRRSSYNREVLRACFEDRLQPLIGQALLWEYERVLGREALFRKAPLSGNERQELLESFLSTCEWVHVYFLWRPNLPDEADNHVLELAVAGGASVIVTNNVSDFRRSQLRFPEIRIATPKEMLRSRDEHSDH
jgi:putative PIN family toxin of toxin-antitoxin system